MPTRAVQNLDEQTRRREEASLSARSPLSKAEKETVMRAEYFPTAHRIGLITSLIHVVIFFLPPLYLTVFYGPLTDWARSCRALLEPGFQHALWFIEPVSYFWLVDSQSQQWPRRSRRWKALPRKIIPPQSLRPDDDHRFGLDGRDLVNHGGLLPVSVVAA
jgi:hypothetical protein